MPAHSLDAVHLPFFDVALGLEVHGAPRLEPDAVRQTMTALLLAETSFGALTTLFPLSGQESLSHLTSIKLE
jgi:hypothetical protein